MALSVSTALKNQTLNAVRGHGTITKSLKGGVGYVYSGTQPASADAAATGTLLGKITVGAGTYAWGAYQTTDRDGVCASSTPSGAGTITINGATSGTLGVGYYVTIYGTGNESAKIFRITGTGDNDEAIIEYLQGPNNSTVSTTNTFKTVTEVYVSAATAAAVEVGYGITNGLMWAIAASGAMTKHASQTWQMVGIAVGIMGYVRFMGAATDDLGVSTTLPRIDMRIATSGAELTASNTSVAIGATTTFDNITIEWP
jgi:hypothetical protein